LLLLSCRPFVVITTLSTGLVTSTHIRPVDNVVITTKGLQDRNNNCLMERRWKIKVKYSDHGHCLNLPLNKDKKCIKKRERVRHLPGYCP
jgi:hypothetical protein